MEKDKQVYLRIICETYKRKGWFHVTVRPSHETSPEHVILRTSPTQTVTRKSSSCGSGDDMVSWPTI